MKRSRLIAVSVLILLAMVVLSNPGGVAHAAGPPSGIVEYVAITLTNSQSAPTPTNFQQQLTVDWSTYSSYLASNAQNVEFFTTQWSPLYAWCESSCSSSATSSSVWVNLGTNTIPAGGTLTVVMGFYPTTANEYSPTGYWGAYPTFTGTYGQYDNGANVFLVYNNGASLFGTSQTGTGGTAPVTTASAPAPNSNAITGSVSGGTAAATTWTTNGETTPALPASYIAQMRVYLTGSSALTDLLTNVQSISTGQFYVFRIDTRSGSYDSIGNYPSGGITTNFLKQTTITSAVDTWYQLTAVDAGDSLSLYKSTSTGINSFGTLEAGPVSGVGYTGGGIAVSTDGATSTEYWTDIVVRAYPPYGVMPSVAFATASSALATPVAYSDSGCTTSPASFDMGQYVYGGFTVAGSGGTPWSFNIIDQSGGNAKTVSPLSSSPYCDSAGYQIPSSNSAGTWTIEVLDTNGVNIGQVTFTVNDVPIPDLPSGVLFLLLPVFAFYMLARRRVKVGY